MLGREGGQAEDLQPGIFLCQLARSHEPIRVCAAVACSALDVLHAEPNLITCICYDWNDILKPCSENFVFKFCLSTFFGPLKIHTICDQRARVARSCQELEFDRI